MLKKIINLYNQFCGVKFRFGLPIKKKIILFDDHHSVVLREIIKEDFDILKVRDDDKEIYFWIFIKQIIFFDFKFMTYCKNYIKFISPKIVITLIDTNLSFYELKNSFKNIHFISIQNGIRTQFFFNTKRILASQDLKCDHFFVFNKYFVKQYGKYINSNYHISGNFKNNIVKINMTKNNNNFLLISELVFGKKSHEKLTANFEEKLMILIKNYFLKANKKIYILLKSKKPLEQKREISYYKKIFKNNCVIQKPLNWKHTYKVVNKFENIIFMYSTLGFEAIARKKKVAIFSPSKVGEFKYHFGWPATYKKSYDFFMTKKITYNEIKRVLNNINKCSQATWQKKYYNTIKDLFFFDEDNLKIKKIISKLL